MARSQRSLVAGVAVVIALAGLLIAGRWLQPRLDRPAPGAPTAASPAPSPPARTTPPGSPGITRTADTALVDAIAVTSRWVWVAAGGQVLRVDPVARRSVVVSGIEATEPPVVRLAAAAGAVWATTTGWRRLWRVDPARDRVVATLRVPPGDLTLAADGLVWATSDTRLLGLGGPEVAGPRRNLWELATDRITATAAAGDGGLWLGTPQGLFHVSGSVLRQP